MFIFTMLNNMASILRKKGANVTYFIPQDKYVHV